MHIIVTTRACDTASSLESVRLVRFAHCAERATRLVNVWKFA